MILPNTHHVTYTPAPTSDPTSAPTDTPTTTIAPTPSDTTTPSPTVDNSANVADTPSPTDSPTDTPTITVNGDNSGSVTNNVTSGGDSGDNTIASASATDTPTPSADPSDTTTPAPTSSNQNNSSGSIQTGNANAATSVNNTVNTNSVNSEVVYQTLNIFVDSVGDLDLSQPFKIAQDVINQDKNDNNVINVKLTGNNYAYVDNALVSTADSGNNTISGTSGTGTAIISTGNADSEVDLLNQVNFNVVNSVVHDITINIYGTVTGNIILPQLLQTSTCTSCGVSINSNNTAVVTNNVNSQAVSGQNTIAGDATINTGNATSNVNILNVVNTNIINSYIEALFLNDLGLWHGNFLGWDNFGAQTGGQNLALSDSGTAPSGGGSVAINTHNTAIVNNTINSTANSGENTIDANSGSITTGNANSVVSMTNFVNSNVIGSLIGLFHINIFGTFNGDIGDPSKFITPTPTTTPEPSGDNNNDSSNNGGGVCDVSGAQVSIDASNNVGAFINPGDTITFFVTINNNGTTDLTNTNLRISLIKDGVDLGDPSFNIGTLGVGKTVKVTAGLAISKNVQPGEYQAKATVSSNTCDSNTNPSASSTTNFVVGGVLSAGTLFVGQAEAAAPTTKPAVLGKSITLTNGLSCGSCTWWQILLGEAVALLAYYIIIDPRLKQKGKMWSVLLIPVITYLIFIALNKSCALGTPWWELWKWHTNFSSLECKFFWTLDGILFALVAWIAKKYKQLKSSKK